MNLSDKDLDRLFREAADRFEPDDKMLSWSRLERNLAGQLPERPPGRFRRFSLRPIVWVPAIVLFAGLSFLLIKNHQPYRSVSTQSNTRPPHVVSPVPATRPSALPDPALTDNNRESGSPGSPAAGSVSASSGAGSSDAKNLSGASPDHAGLASAGADSERLSAQGTSVDNDKGMSRVSRIPVSTTAPEHSASASTTFGPVTAGTKAERRTDSFSDPLSDRVSDPLTEMHNRQLAADKKSPFRAHVSRAGHRNGAMVSSIINADAADEIFDSGASLPASAGKAGALPVKLKNAQVHLPDLYYSGSPSVEGSNRMLLTTSASRLKSLSLTSLSLPSQSLPSQSLPSRSLQLRQPLTIGLVTGPDYTDGGVTNSQLGNSLGISISFYLNQRLSLNSGILYGIKSYSARGKDFQPPRDPLRAAASFPHFESANGTITLFEIPLSLRYDVPVDSKTRFFVNAGLSSYLPVKETFTTFFQDQGRIYAWRHIDNDPPSHWFAIGHFSGGIERDLGKGISFQVEPYLNLPFTHISAGNVRLKTYGLLFSVRFTPVLGRSKR